MIIEYANKKEDTRKVLKPLILSMIMYIAREYRLSHEIVDTDPLSSQLFSYMESHSDTITLSDLAAHFGYHPVYLSRLLAKLFGKNFSSLLLDIRMKKAKILLDHTDLTIEKLLPCLVTATAAISTNHSVIITGNPRVPSARIPRLSFPYFLPAVLFQGCRLFFAQNAAHFQTRARICSD